MSNKLNMTEAQIERQGKKIMDILFTDIVEETDSGYTAEINPKVINLFKSEIPFDEALEESELGDILMRLIQKICDFVNKESKGINQKFLAAYISDFVSQTLSSAFSIEEIEKKDDTDNMMYG
tara:strand:- start:338 stop:706 length:369 start_codon:yes stop_codon:yes gene_type:complete